MKLLPNTTLSLNGKLPQLPDILKKIENPLQQNAYKAKLNVKP